MAAFENILAVEAWVVPVEVAVVEAMMVELMVKGLQAGSQDEEWRRWLSPEVGKGKAVIDAAVVGGCNRDWGEEGDDEGDGDGDGEVGGDGV